MKGFLISALLLLLPPMVTAQIAAPRVVTDVEQTLRSTMTCVSLLISSATSAGGQATQVIASTQTLWGSVTIQNKDSAANTYFSDNVNVASGTANGILNPLTGYEVYYSTGQNSWTTSLAPGELLYGVNDSGARSTVITICKGR